MKSLEEELGVTLFERKNRGFHLTRAGKFFYQKSQLEKMTTKATSNLYCEFPLLQNQQPIERDYFLFYHLERAHPYTEDFLEIAKRYFG